MVLHVMHSACQHDTLYDSGEVSILTSLYLSNGMSFRGILYRNPCVTFSSALFVHLDLSFSAWLLAVLRKKMLEHQCLL